MPLDALAKRLTGVLASNDRPTMYVYSHNASLRVGRQPRAYNPASPARDEEGAPEVRKAAAGLMAALEPGREREMGRAREALEGARKLREQAYYRRRGATSAASLHNNQAYAYLTQSE